MEYFSSMNKRNNLIHSRQNLNRTLNNAKLSMENGLAYQSDVDEAKRRGTSG